MAEPVRHAGHSIRKDGRVSLLIFAQFTLEEFGEAEIALTDESIVKVNCLTIVAHRVIRTTVVVLIVIPAIVSEGQRVPPLDLRVRPLPLIGRVHAVLIVLTPAYLFLWGGLIEQVHHVNAVTNLSRTITFDRAGFREE